jgi:hypothetical protein
MPSTREKTAAFRKSATSGAPAATILLSRCSGQVEAIGTVLARWLVPRYEP